jgi:glycosyltransferase involved in cell wall biosynthesis
MDEPLVSIIMNCYNSDRFLREAIESIYNQTYSNWEIIFWDNASTDDSADIAKSYDGKLKYYCSDKTTNIGTARNLAIECTKGQIVTFLDTDDIWLPNKLTKQVAMYNRGWLVVYGKFQFIDEDKLELPQKIINFPSGYILKHLLLKNNPVSQGCVAIDRELLLEYMYDSHYKLLCDFDLWVRVANHHKFGLVDEIVELSRLHGQNTTFILGSEWKNERRYFAKKMFKELDLGLYPLIFIYIIKQEIKRLVKNILNK